MRSITLLICISIVVVSCQTQFDSEVWNDPINNLVTTKPNPRFDMANDVLENYLEIGQTKTQVQNILGEASRDTLHSRIPEGVTVPDSLRMKNILKQNINRQEELISQLNTWYKTNSEEVKAISYYVGWTLADPVSLIIFLDDYDKVTGFELHQH